MRVTSGVVCPGWRYPQLLLQHLEKVVRNHRKLYVSSVLRGHSDDVGDLVKDDRMICELTLSRNYHGAIHHLLKRHQARAGNSACRAHRLRMLRDPFGHL